jgi:hypothetical protein
MKALNSAGIGTVTCSGRLDMLRQKIMRKHAAPDFSSQRTDPCYRAGHPSAGTIG